jgi:superfamily I DNA and/or RNA helicase
MNNNKSVIESLVLNARHHLLDTSFNNRMINSKITLNKGLSFSVEDLNAFYQLVINKNPFSFLPLENKKTLKEQAEKTLKLESNKKIEKIGISTTVSILDSTNKPSVFPIRFTLDEGDSQLVYNYEKEKDFVAFVEQVYAHVKKNFTKYGIIQDNIYNKNVHFKGFRRLLQNDVKANGLSIYISLVSLLRGEGVPKDYAFIGELNDKFELNATSNIVDRLIAASEKGITKVFIPKKNKKDIKLLPLDVVNMLEIVYLANIDEAILSIFEMINSINYSEGESEFIVSKSTQPQKIFYVNYNRDDLKNRIDKIHFNSKRHIEEQGINILFLSLAFVQWTNEANNDEIINSPLVFVPVSIEASSYKNVYKLTYSNSEVLLNKSLIKKLELEYNIDFSGLAVEVDDESEFNVLEYIDQFYDIIKLSGHDFGLDYHSVHLSFYSYNKFLMYNDLDPGNWDGAFDGSKKNVLSDIFLHNIYHEISNIDDDKNIDHSLEIENINNIVDADSSQLLAISKVNRGNSIIIQGPPGTGKSQTIVNIIAESVKQNKKVLFMSEKLAAMDVVYNRLKAVNLDHIALQLHSDKVSKAQVVKELQNIYYMNKINVKNTDQDIQAKLSKLKLEINQYYALLEKQAIHSKMDLIALYKNIIEIENYFEHNKVKHYELEIPNQYLMNLSDYEYDQLHNKISALENFYVKYGALQDSVLNCISLKDTLTHHDLIRYQNMIAGVVKELNALSKQITYTKIAASKGGNFSIEEVKALLQIAQVDSDLLDHLTKVNHNQMLEHKEYLETLFEHFNNTLEDNVLVDETALKEAKHLDQLKTLVDSLEKDIRFFNQYKSHFSRNKKLYKDFKANALRKYFVVDNVKHNDLLESLKWLYSKAFVRYETQKEEVKIEKIFGIGNKDKYVDLDHIIRLYNTVEELYSSLSSLFSNYDENPGNYYDYFKKILAKDIELKTLETTMNQINTGLQIQYERIDQESYQTLSIKELVSFLKDISKNLAALNDVTKQKEVKDYLETTLTDDYLTSLIQDEYYTLHISKIFHYIRYHSIVKEILEQNETLETFNAMMFEQKIKEFTLLDNKNIQMNHLQNTLDAHFYHVYNVRKDETLSVEEKDDKISYLLQTFNKKHNIPAVKQLLKNAFEPITDLKPVLMMSPISIAQYLEPTIGMFDVVVFDEASQIKPQDAFGALLRGKQVVVVGDEKQLPPTNFFESYYGSTEVFTEDAISNFESILTLLRGSGVPLTTLNWHYRSKHHNLIQISNEHFYDKSLSIFPSKYKNNPEYGLKYEFVNGIFDRGRSRTNAIEAKHVATQVVKHIKANPKLSLGVATLNINQRDMILSELKKLSKNDEEVLRYLNEDRNEAFFVKNLENVQGDEREVIFISIGYAKDKNGNIIQNFGAINHVGGERRLNVLMTRARQKCVIFTGLKSTDLEVDYGTAEGVKVLRKFLFFAEQQTESEQEVINAETQVIASEIAEELHNNGYEVAYNVGNSQYFIDLAVINPNDSTQYILGIEFDNSSYNQSRTASERERIRTNVMRAKGWIIYRVYLTSWFNNRAQETQDILTFLKEIEKQTHKEEPLQIEFYEEPVNVVTRFGFEPYKKFTKQIENIKFFMKEHDNFTQYIADIIYAEMPIKENTILQRVLENSHVKVKVNIIKKHVKKALKSLENKQIIYKNTDFYHFYKKEDYITFRDRRAFTDVQLSDISDQEFLYAIEEIAGNSFGINTIDITSIISNYLGYEGQDAAVLEKIETLSIRLVNNGILFKDDNNNLQKNK